MDNPTEVIGIVAGFCTSISLLPQLIKIIREKTAQNISLFYLIILFVGLGLWIYYGVKRDDIPIILTNVVAILINLAMIVAGLKYKKRNPGVS